MLPASIKQIKDYKKRVKNAEKGLKSLSTECKEATENHPESFIYNVGDPVAGLWQGCLYRAVVLARSFAVPTEKDGIQRSDAPPGKQFDPVFNSEGEKMWPHYFLTYPQFTVKHDEWVPQVYVYQRDVINNVRGTHVSFEKAVKPREEIIAEETIADLVKESRTDSYFSFPSEVKRWLLLEEIMRRELRAVPITARPSIYHLVLYFYVFHGHTVEGKATEAAKAKAKEDEEKENEEESKTPGGGTHPSPSPSPSASAGMKKKEKLPKGQTAHPFPSPSRSPPPTSPSPVVKKRGRPPKEQSRSKSQPAPKKGVEEALRTQLRGRGFEKQGGSAAAAAAPSPSKGEKRSQSNLPKKEEEEEEEEKEKGRDEDSGRAGKRRRASLPPTRIVRGTSFEGKDRGGGRDLKEERKRSLKESDVRVCLDLLLRSCETLLPCFGVPDFCLAEMEALQQENSEAPLSKMLGFECLLRVLVWWGDVFPMDALKGTTQATLIDTVDALLSFIASRDSPFLKVAAFVPVSLESRSGEGAMGRTPDGQSAASGSGGGTCISGSSMQSVDVSKSRTPPRLPMRGSPEFCEAEVTLKNCAEFLMGHQGNGEVMLKPWWTDLEGSEEVDLFLERQRVVAEDWEDRLDDPEKDDDLV
uniref:Uncharacterized protein n=1 Tax=Chromera velia CCMP2878 TaxID=1169474 RepID=A0A0G4G0P9_9ALVE|eukprot:Cvel_521.t1-p1 / transcript=Cvel_521.t1 / gene=Cvel_521 / organism=Chromera_velia_CCMP2878 / gene_product=hypothetical protein / transcript_product=hypothetical protein / location=Cvel_scaffold16:95454-98332(-) / protein_length=640 / sequence_SO=supercontig / SO=protein_coding / is_pseudo=false